MRDVDIGSTDKPVIPISYKEIVKVGEIIHSEHAPPEHLDGVLIDRFAVKPDFEDAFTQYSCVYWHKRGDKAFATGEVCESRGSGSNIGFSR